MWKNVNLWNSKEGILEKGLYLFGERDSWGGST